MAGSAFSISLKVSHAGRAQHADLRAIVTVLQRLQQRLGSGAFAGERSADPVLGIGRRRLVPADRIETGVEGGKRPQMRRRDMPLRVLDQVQILDQQIPPPRPVCRKRPNRGLDPPAPAEVPPASSGPPLQTAPQTRCLYRPVTCAIPLPTNEFARNLFPIINFYSCQSRPKSCATLPGQLRPTKRHAWCTLKANPLLSDA